MSEIELIHSPLILAGLVLSLGGSLALFSYYRDINTAVLFLGFFVLLITKLLESYCMRVSMLSIEVAGLGYLCGPAIPHISGIGFLLIGAGLVLHVLKLQKKKCNNF